MSGRDDGGSGPPFRQVRADFDDETLVVYQAYPTAIAGPAVATQHFVAPFSRERMTWIKPSFLWMMYRCGWATKPGQERVHRLRDLPVEERTDLPVERPYPLPPEVAAAVGGSSS